MLILGNDKKFLRAVGIFCLFVIGMISVFLYPVKKTKNTSTSKLADKQSTTAKQQEVGSLQVSESFRSPPKIVISVNFNKVQNQ